MSAFSNYLEEQILKHIFRTGSFSKPTAIAVALLTTGPGESDSGQFSVGTGVEVANANGYARQTLNPSDSNWKNPATATQGTTNNLSTITFGPASGGDWGTITHVSIVTSATYDSGEMLFYGELDTAKEVLDGDSFVFNIGSLQVSLD